MNSPVFRLDDSPFLTGAKSELAFLEVLAMGWCFPYPTCIHHLIVWLGCSDPAMASVGKWGSMGDEFLAGALLDGPV